MGLTLGRGAAAPDDTTPDRASAIALPARVRQMPGRSILRMAGILLFSVLGPACAQPTPGAPVDDADAGDHGMLPVVFAHGLIDGWVVELSPDASAAWQVEVPRLSGSLDELSFTASMSSRTAPDEGDLTFSASFVMAQVFQDCVDAYNNVLGVPISPIVPSEACRESEDECIANLAITLEPRPCFADTLLQHYKVMISWLRVYSGPSGLWLQWMQPRESGTCRHEPCTVGASFLVYGPIPESDARPLEDLKAGDFDYVAWLKRTL